METVALTSEQKQIILSILDTERYNHGDLGYEVITEIMEKLKE